MTGQNDDRLNKQIELVVSDGEINDNNIKFKKMLDEESLADENQ
jgi:hypothetical protein